MNASALELLQSVFGYPSFRGQQQAVVEHLHDGGDALVLMPTGGGKSLCYQIPALLRQGTGIVVSPLIALMQDQVDALREAGVSAAYLNSSLGAEEQREVERQLLAGELNLLYVAPERLLTQRFLGQLERTEVALFAIDEAHCVSQWGHDFRPEYRELAILHQRFPEVPRIALTATADPRTRDEIVERLSLQAARQFVSSFDRPNIGYRVGLRHNAKRQLTEFLQGHQGESGIVYCLSRKKVDDTAQWLAEMGVEALPYHAGLDAPTRAKNQKRFLREDGVVMVATVAFGMGIDKPDVRFVAHLDLPRSIEGYYQETGRAGRDGLTAEAWMIYGLSDVVTMSQMIAQSESADERKRVERQKLESLLAYAEATDCRRQLLLGTFGETYPGPCGHCDNCVAPPKTWDATVPAQKALSAVYRTGQRFGSGHVIDVLRGEETERVLSLRSSSAQHVRHRCGNGRQAVALGVPPIARGRPAGSRCRRLRHLAPYRRQSRRARRQQTGEAARGCPARTRQPSPPRQQGGHRLAVSASRPTSRPCGTNCAPCVRSWPDSRACRRTWCSTTPPCWRCCARCRRTRTSWPPSAVSARPS